MKTLALFITITFVCSHYAFSQHDLAGTWLNKSKGSIQIYKEGNVYSGKQISDVYEKNKVSDGRIVAKDFVKIEDNLYKGKVIRSSGKELNATGRLSEDGKTLTIKVTWSLFSHSIDYIRIRRQ